jgi:protein-tyrosine-phosphatase
VQTWWVWQGFGVGISGHRAWVLSRMVVASADPILVMEKFHLKFVKMKSFLNSVSIGLLTEYDPDKEPYNVPDPLGEPIEIYKASARVIDNCFKGVHACLDTIFRNE